MSVTTTYALLTDAQIAGVLRTALNPSNRFLPINNPIRIPFLAVFIDALGRVKAVARRPYGRLLDELIDSYREFLHIGCPVPQCEGDVLWCLGVILSDRFDENGIKQDLEDSINAFRDCLAIANYSKPRWITLHMLGSRQANLCIKFDSMNNIDEAISTLNDCLKVYSEMSGIDSQPTDDAFRLADVRNTLGYIHYKRFEFRSKKSLQVTSVSEVGPPTVLSKECEEDLNVAILNYEESHRLHYVCRQPIPWASRGDLAACYSTRFQWLGDREDNEKSIELYQIAISEISPSDESYPDVLSRLAYCLAIKYNTYGRSEDLHAAIIRIEQALTLRPDNTRYHRQRAEMYQHRFAITNDVGNLDTAISETRKCLDPNMLQGSRQAVAVRQLATTLRQRFETTRVVEDLDEAIGMVRGLVDEFRRGITTRSNSDDWDVFSEYGGLLLKKFEVTGNINDLHESRSQYEMALRLVPYHSNHRPLIMCNYAGLLLELYENTDKVEHLNKSIDMYREANHLKGDKDVHNLYLCGASLIIRAARTHERNNGKLDDSADHDLKDAMEYLRDSESLIHPDHPTRSLNQNVLGQAYLLKGGPENQQIAFELFEHAVKRITATPRYRLAVGHNWIGSAIELQDFKEATRAYGHTMDVLYRFLSTNPTLASQHQLIQSRKHDNLLSHTFASDATHVAIRAGNPKRAVELLEQGRGLLWSRLNHYQYPLDQLQDAEPMLAKKYEELSKKLENLAISPVNLEVKRATDSMMEELHAASKEWDETVEQIRKVDGFSEFHKPLGYNSLKKAATDGPVIIINASGLHEHLEAIIILSEGDPVTIPLPNATLLRISEMCATLKASLDTIIGRKYRVPPKRYGSPWWQSRNRGDSDTSDSDSDSDDEDEDDEEVKEAREKLMCILQFLWESIVYTVVEKLQELSIEQGSRIWWCPTAFTCTLPLHAAGPYKEGQDNLFDLYISSYLRCLSSSHHIRQTTNSIPRGELATSTTRLLAISCPGEPGTDDYLDSVEKEVGEVIKCFSISDTSALKVLDGPQADPDSVISHLPQYPWVHFSCHGNQHREPFKSSFQVYGGKKVTLLHLMQARNPYAELAFLSACDTAAGDTDGTPDEVIHLVSTLQFIGFKSVIGTLWPMYDADGPDLARDFYGYLLGEGKGDYRMSAVALHEATTKMRERDIPLERWVNFVHFGA